MRLEMGDRYTPKGGQNEWRRSARSAKPDADAHRKSMTGFGETRFGRLRALGCVPLCDILEASTPVCQRAWPDNGRAKRKKITGKSALQ